MTPGPFSVGQFSQPTPVNVEGYGVIEPMSFYPTTDCVFQARITLRAGEEFVRFKMVVVNPTEKDALGEAWFPQTYPITEESKIISPQRMRWKRDGWCFPDIAQLFPWDKEKFVKPLDWPTDGIFYDFPSKDGTYHAVSAGDGTGCACVTRDEPDEPQFTKLWSWGQKASGDDGLSQGRPATEYYEPWASAFNFAFFQVRVRVGVRVTLPLPLPLTPTLTLTLALTLAPRRPTTRAAKRPAATSRVSAPSCSVATAPGQRAALRWRD